jgi:cytochrome bd ubiquinol oxidase subunit I
MTGTAQALLASSGAASSAFGAPDPHYLFEARQLQALSFAAHIPLVCFGIAFPALVVFAEWLHQRTGDPVYGVLARRWSKAMLALFAVGVVTGTILSFEMGLLWPNFTATFGAVFGLGFAIEGFSFFIEAIFIGIYVYGWGRLSPRTHLLTGIPVVITGFTGSWMVIAVNAWMNHPGGFKLVGGKVVDVHPLSALFGNTYLWHELLHMYIAGYIVVGFVVASVYGFARLRGNGRPPTRYERTAFAIPLTIAALAAPVQVLVGDWAGREVATYQPIKLAAIEGLGRTTKGPDEHILGWYTNGEVKFGIAIPHGLSLLAFHTWNAKVQGLDSVPASDRPPVNIERFAFQTMVGMGTLMAILGVFFLYIRIRRRRLPQSVWFYRAVILAGPAALVALIAGWMTTEIGRQPWVVYNVMRTSQAVTGAGGLPVGYATLALTYVGVAIALVWILRRLARAPMAAPRAPAASAASAAGS